MSESNETHKFSQPLTDEEERRLAAEAGQQSIAGWWNSSCGLGRRLPVTRRRPSGPSVQTEGPEPSQFGPFCC
jgi:hypothetical protein